MAPKLLPASNFTTRLASEYSHPSEALSFFQTTSWCQAIINSPVTRSIATPSLESKHTTEDALFATLLRGNNERHRETIRSCVSYRRSHKTMNPNISKSSDGLSVGGRVAGTLQETTIEGRAEDYDEVLTMISVGNGMDGHEGILHGGFIAMILDEVMGMAGGLYARKSTFTASLKLDYRNPISTPGIILVKGKTEKQRGRKLWVNGSIEDGQGLVFAEAEGLWVEFKEQNL